MFSIQSKLKRQKGFTIIELLIAVVIAAIVLAMALPSFSEMLARKRLETAMEKLAADIQFARSEAIKRNQDVYIQFDETNDCYGVSLTTGCSCNASPTTCTIDGVSKAVDVGESDINISNVTFPSDEASFDPRRGMLQSPSRGVTFYNEYAARVNVTVMGRVRICIPSPLPSGTKATFNYPDC